jgi:hypothetical protein
LRRNGDGRLEMDVGGKGVVREKKFKVPARLWGRRISQPGQDQRQAAADNFVELC